MHENRFIRLLIVIGIAVGGSLLFGLLPQAFGVNNTDLLLQGLILAAVSALIIEIIWSVLDFSIFDNFIFTIFRWAIVAVVAFVSIGATGSVLGALKDSIQETQDLNFFAYTFMCTSTACPGAMIATCLAYTRPTYDDREEYSWAILAGYGVSFGVGVIFGLLSLIGVGFASIAPIFAFIIGILLIPAAVLLFGYPLGDVGDFDGFYEVIKNNLKNRSKKPTKSYTSSSSGNKTVSKSSTYSTAAKNTTYIHEDEEEEEEEVDNRKFSFMGLKTEMYEIAKKYDGRIISLSFDSNLYLSVTNSISGHNINYTVKAKLKSGYVTNEYDARRVNDDITNELQKLVNDIVNEAYDKLDALREKYSNFDEEYEVNAQVGDITPY